MGEPVVAASGVTKIYRESLALDRVDLTVEAGTVHGVVGPNGAGKTTLLSLLLGLALPDEGEVRLFGRTRAEAGAAWLDGVGGGIETPRFYPHLTGAQNLRALARLDDGDSGAADVEAVLAAVGLTDTGRGKVRGWSLGMRQRLALAAALLRRPRLLVLDEPTNGLDVLGVRDLTAAVRDLAAAGTAVVFSSHDVRQVEALCDRVTVLSRGTTAFDGTITALRAAAPPPTWTVRTSDDETALGLLAPAYPARHSGDGDGLLVTAATADLDRAVLALAADGVAVRGLVEATSPLEALFAQLTAARRDDPVAVR